MDYLLQLGEQSAGSNLKNNAIVFSVNNILLLKQHCCVPGCLTATILATVRSAPAGNSAWKASARFFVR